MPSPPEPHPLAARILFPVLRGVVWMLLLVFGAPMFARGRRNVPRRGPLLILANHCSNSDPVIVQWACPRLAHFMARTQLFDMPRIGDFMRWWKAFPVLQSSADTGALKTALQLLEEGRCVVVFPEGQLSPDGSLIELLPGVALIARKSGAPVVCCGLRGTEKVMPNPDTRLRWSGHRIVARFGRPRTFDREAETEEVLGWATEDLRRLSRQDRESPTLSVSLDDDR